MGIDFNTATFKDFENIKELDAFERAKKFGEFTDFMIQNGHMNYRLIATSASGPEMEIVTPFSHGKPENYISFVSNDYLNFSQHPKVKQAALQGISQYGTGSGASPLIGGHFNYHEEIERKIAGFFGRDKNCSVIFTTGYTANSATLLSLLKKEDIAIVDRAVHTSVYEGLKETNVKSFSHNNLDSLEHILKTVKNSYRTKLVIVDGVYSQDGDMAPLDRILEISKQYGAFIMVDDAHGIGVLGKTGRGAIEEFELLNEIDIISGTFSKTFGNIGGYVISSAEIINFIKFQSKQQIFSATSTPASAGIIKAIELIDEEPHWRSRLIENISYFKKELLNLNFNIGTTVSAIIPIKIGDPYLTSEAGKMLLKAGIFTNPILYPAVSRKDARIRMSLMATHTKEHLDKTLEALEYVKHKLQL
ncbi:glycine C-acetyltransferase [Pedobacter sp. CG_S7]|uniref:aminotransferase class I/II-fold pyridoxal phosphate-dependent enzyme n=1 Tax=Pedobacter sp. CG_S7 TaxID=3143930 RepID=UPI003399D815